MEVKDLLFLCNNLRWGSIIQIYKDCHKIDEPLRLYVQESYCQYAMRENIAPYDNEVVVGFKVTKDGIKIWI